MEPIADVEPVIAGDPRSALTAVLLLAALSACGGNPARLETAPVRGKVTLDGGPVTSGIVRFVPDRGRAGRGDIRPDGTFTITTYEPEDGAVVGHHRVAVIAQGGPAEEFTEDVEQVEWLVPERYANPSTSGLEFEVRSGETNIANVKLASEPSRE